MTAGVRGILTGASILGHPLDTAGYPRVCRSEDWGLLTRLAPGYQVAGSDQERQRQVKRIEAIKELPGGQELFSGLNTSSPPQTLEVVGALPGGKNAKTQDIEGVDSAVAACFQITSLMGVDWAPGAQATVTGSETGLNWPYLVGLLKSTKIPCMALPAQPSGIDDAIFKGIPIVLGLKKTNFEFTVVTSIVTSQEHGTLARMTLATPHNDVCVVAAEHFDQMLDPNGIVATRNPVFEATAHS